MKFSCTQENLKRGLLLVSNLSSRSITLPILNNTHVKTNDGLLELCTTNLDIGIKTIVRGKVDEEGVVTVPTKVLADYISLLPSGSIDLVATNTDVEIFSAGQRSKLKGLAADDFPILPVLDPHIRFSLTVEQLSLMIARVIFSVAQDVTRPEISGILLKKDSGRLVGAATDGFRLAESNIEVLQDIPDFSIIIPFRTIQEVSRICSLFPHDREVVISFNESQINFTLDSTTLISRLIEGKYPEYAQIIPNTFSFVSLFQNKGFIHALRLNGLFTKKGTNDIVCEFLAPKTIILSSGNIQVGENRTEIEAEVGGNDHILFNYKYLLDGLSIFGPDDQVVMKVVNQNSPILLVSEAKKDFRYLVMPIRQ